jgi:hypothetical protein
MPEVKRKPALYAIGDRLRLKQGQPLVGTVSEVRHTHSPEGHNFYRVRVPMDPEPLWLEVREDEVEKV